MKRIIAIIMAAALIAAIFCACGEEELTIDKKYVRAYVLEENTLAEQSVRTVELFENGTYLYTRESSDESKNGQFPGRWGVNSKGVIIFSANESGKTSEATPSSDGMTLNISDVGHVNDTVGSGVYVRKKDE